MLVYIYETTNGLIADFRPYLDGQDNAFEPPRPLKGGDPRWEKIQNCEDPRTGDLLYGQSKFAGMGEIEDYHELMIFPIAFNGATEPKTV